VSEGNDLEKNRNFYALNGYMGCGGGWGWGASTPCVVVCYYHVDDDVVLDVFAT
jgi:hypothetical protein